LIHDRVIHYLPFFLSSFHLLQAEDVARAFDIILHRGEIAQHTTYKPKTSKED